MLLAVCLAGSLVVPGVAWSDGGAPVTQRRINEWAGALQRARYALIEETGLRRPEEPVNAYLGRVVRPLPGERPDVYRRRIAGYVAALSSAATATSGACRMPALRDSGAANSAVWRRALSAIAALPEHVRRMQAAEPACFSGQPRRFNAELAESVALVLSAYLALRDAQP